MPCAQSKEQGVEYNDSLSDIAFIALCRRAYGDLAGWQSAQGWMNGEETYKGMVEVSRALMKVHGNIKEMVREWLNNEIRWFGTV